MAVEETQIGAQRPVSIEKQDVEKIDHVSEYSGPEALQNSEGEAVTITWKTWAVIFVRSCLPIPRDTILTHIGPILNFRSFILARSHYGSPANKTLHPIRRSNISSLVCASLHNWQCHRFLDCGREFRPLWSSSVPTLR